MDAAGVDGFEDGQASAGVQDASGFPERTGKVVQVDQNASGDHSISAGIREWKVGGVRDDGAESASAEGRADFPEGWSGAVDGVDLAAGADAGERGEGEQPSAGADINHVIARADASSGQDTVTDVVEALFRRSALLHRGACKPAALEPLGRRSGLPRPGQDATSVGRKVNVGPTAPRSAGASTARPSSFSAW